MAHQNVTPNAGLPVSSSRLSLAGLQPKPSQLSAVTSSNAGTHKLSLLLDIEAEARNAETVNEWKFVVANETLKITDAIQVFVFKNDKDMRLIAISGLTGFDRATPLVKNIEQLVKCEIENKQPGGLSVIREILFAPDNANCTTTYPFSRFHCAIVSTVSHTIKIFARFSDNSEDVLPGMSGTVEFEKWLIRM